ncbi:protein FMC1 homolog [Saccoglossus kowalevskii]|uniref:Protein FMC1 homolog n=1 Tax=Saccoglossus kowalevskii TaxID=10224 RepID=A0ABM0H131_SACKO|nr:PREDICTED: UPF0562 protein C7orf55 homolog [Saccoglossus kowalevskii]
MSIVTGQSLLDRVLKKLLRLHVFGKQIIHYCHGDATNGSTLTLLRHLVRELRHCHNKKPVQKSLAYNYIINEYRRHNVTSERTCKGENELKHKANTYLSLLHNARRYQELHAEYKGSELSVQSAADLMGFKLPSQPDNPV